MSDPRYADRRIDPLDPERPLVIEDRPSFGFSGAILGMLAVALLLGGLILYFNRDTTDTASRPVDTNTGTVTRTVPAAPPAAAPNKPALPGEVPQRP